VIEEGFMTAPWDDDAANPVREDRVQQTRLRFWKAETAILTILITAWLISLGPIPAVLSLLVAKHVLVAVMLVRQERGESGNIHE
jgi:hypothetical protein